jgi:hypothetical protein
MRLIPDDESGEAWRRLRREHAQQEAQLLVPRPGHPIYGLAAPPLPSAGLTGHASSNGKWTSVTLAFGQWDAASGPYIEVTTEATDAAMRIQAGSPSAFGDGPEADLWNAIDREQRRPIGWGGAAGAAGSAGAAGAAAEQADAAGPPLFSRERLPDGDALVGRSGDVWAAHWAPPDPPLKVAVTIVGRGVAPDSVELQPLADLRPMIDAREAFIAARIERGRREPRPPLPELEPAEGVAAFRALAEFTLAASAQRRAERRDRGPRRPGARRSPSEAATWGGMHSALWQRAVREQRRLRGTNAATADYVVTEVVNHLGFLGEEAPWFAADPRLRETAIDETLRRAMLGDAVPSEPAQEAWARHWAARMARPPLDPAGGDVWAAVTEREERTATVLRAWAEWAETA